MQHLTTLVRLLRITRTFPTVGKLNYMNGPGSRSTQNKMFGRMPGMTLRSLKVHYDLIPIVVIIVFAIIYPTLYAARLALKATDVSWKKEQEPYEIYSAKEYKLLNPSGNHVEATTPSPRPNYREE